MGRWLPNMKDPQRSDNIDQKEHEKKHHQVTDITKTQRGYTVTYVKWDNAWVIWYHKLTDAISDPSYNSNQYILIKYPPSNAKYSEISPWRPSTSLRIAVASAARLREAHSYYHLLVCGMVPQSLTCWLLLRIQRTFIGIDIVHVIKDRFLDVNVKWIWSYINVHVRGIMSRCGGSLFSVQVVSSYSFVISR